MTRATPFVHPLGLKHYEWKMIRDARHAWTLVPNGHFLPTPCKANVNAAARLVERGYLTMVPGNFSPPQPDWIVVVLTLENLEAYNRDLEAKL